MTCNDGQGCYRSSDVCNGYPACRDLTDEIGCREYLAYSLCVDSISSPCIFDGNQLVKNVIFTAKSTFIFCRNKWLMQSIFSTEPSAAWPNSLMSRIRKPCQHYLISDCMKLAAVRIRRQNKKILPNLASALFSPQYSYVLGDMLSICWSEMIELSISQPTEILKTCFGRNKRLVLN